MSIFDSGVTAGTCSTEKIVPSVESDMTVCCDAARLDLKGIITVRCEHGELTLLVIGVARVARHVIGCC